MKHLSPEAVRFIRQHIGDPAHLSPSMLCEALELALEQKADAEQSVRALATLRDEQADKLDRLLVQVQGRAWSA